MSAERSVPAVGVASSVRVVLKKKMVAKEVNFSVKGQKEVVVGMLFIVIEETL